MFRFAVVQILVVVSSFLNAQTIVFQRTDDKCKDWYPTMIYGDNYALYNNSSNYYTIVAEGTICDDLVVTVDSGSVQKNGCNFNIQPNVQNAKFDFNIFVKSDLGVDTSEWLVVEPPIIKIEINGICFQHQHYLSTKLDSIVTRACHKTEAVTIDSFCFVWTRGDSTIFSQVMASYVFPDSIVKRFQLYGRKDDLISIPQLWYTRNGVNYFLENGWSHRMHRSPFR